MAAGDVQSIGLTRPLLPFPPVPSSPTASVSASTSTSPTSTLESLSALLGRLHSMGIVGSGSASPTSSSSSSSSGPSLESSSGTSNRARMTFPESWSGMLELGRAESPSSSHSSSSSPRGGGGGRRSLVSFQREVGGCTNNSLHALRQGVSRMASFTPATLTPGWGVEREGHESQWEPVTVALLFGDVLAASLLGSALCSAL